MATSDTTYAGARDPGVVTLDVFGVSLNVTAWDGRSGQWEAPVGQGAGSEGEKGAAPAVGWVVCVVLVAVVAVIVRLRGRGQAP